MEYGSNQNHLVNRNEIKKLKFISEIFVLNSMEIIFAIIYDLEMQYSDLWKIIIGQVDNNFIVIKYKPVKMCNCKHDEYKLTIKGLLITGCQLKNV